MSEPDTDVLSDFSAAAGKFVPRARKLLSSAMISAAMLQSPGLAPEASAAMQRRLTERLRDIESLLSDLSVLSSLKSDPADRVSFTEIVRSAVRGADALPLHIADIKAEIPEDEIFVRSPRTALSASVMSLIRNAAEAHATEIRISLLLRLHGFSCRGRQRRRHVRRGRQKMHRAIFHHQGHGNRSRTRHSLRDCKIIRRHSPP